jgi:hypothetical protein
MKNLKVFQYNQTQLCAPPDSAFQAWLQGLAGLSTSGLTCAVTSAEDVQALPRELSLSQNYPNPFNPQTTMEYTLPSRSHVRLIIFDALGREIRTLVDAEQSAGYQHTMWDGVDATGGKAPSGLYFYRLIVNGNSVGTRKLLLLK